MQVFSLVLVLVVFAVMASAGRVMVRDHVPANWERISTPLIKSQKLNLRISLFPRDGSLLEKTLLEVSTPGSAKFRQYLKQDQIADMVGRSTGEIDQLRHFFSKNGVQISSVHPHRDWIFVDATVEQIENIFKCQLAQFRHKIRETTRINAVTGYTIPDEISKIVNFVAGMTTFSFSHWSSLSSKANLNADAYSKVTPQTIYDNYQVPNTGSHGSKLGSQAVVEFGNLANFNTADLQTFFDDFQPSLKGETCGVVAGSNNGDIRGSVEANLDVQYIMATGVFVNTSDYKISGSGGIEDEFLDYTILVNSQIQPPLVHSISYGEYGGSYDNTTDQQFSYELQKMGIAGVSVLLASGDNGVGCDNTGSSQEFDYPSSPYITMVGATQIDALTQKETGATLSSGGFSKDFMQASWQADAVKGYFASGVKLPSEDYYAAGRAYPDVAAYGQNVQVVAGGKVEGVAGTSCSAPIFAGVVALLNDELMSQGLPPLGFLNPWMYANPQMFTDITEGSNPYEKCSGFTAAVGWDPVTGLGTPLYSAMRTAAFAAVAKK